MNFKRGDFVKVTSRGERMYPFLIGKVKYSVLGTSPVGELIIYNPVTDTTIYGVHASAFEPFEAEPVSKSKATNTIAITFTDNEVTASKGDSGVTLKVEDSLRGTAHKALNALFTLLEGSKFLNTQICVVKGNEVLKTGHIYPIKNGKLVGVTGDAFGNTIFHSMKEVVNKLAESNIKVVEVCED